MQLPERFTDDNNSTVHILSFGVQSRWSGSYQQQTTNGNCPGGFPYTAAMLSWSSRSTMVALNRTLMKITIIPVCVLARHRFTCQMQPEALESPFHLIFVLNLNFVVDVLAWRRSDLSSFWLVANSAGRHFSVWVVSNCCRRFGLSSFWFVILNAPGPLTCHCAWWARAFSCQPPVDAYTCRRSPTNKAQSPYVYLSIQFNRCIVPAFTTWPTISAIWSIYRLAVYMAVPLRTGLPWSSVVTVCI